MAQAIRRSNIEAIQRRRQSRKSRGYTRAALNILLGVLVMGAYLVGPFVAVGLQDSAPEAAVIHIP